MSLRQFPRTLALSATTLVLAAVGCASTPTPPELLDARSAYTRAESGAAAQFKPDSLHEAKVALEKAERSYADDPGKQKTKDIAYVATRRAELAEVEGRDAKLAQEKTAAEQNIAKQTQTQYAQAQRDLSSTGQKLAASQEQLASERAARQAAEKRAKEAMDRLASSSAGSVKQESRGTVITLPGGVFFASGKTALLPGARDKLNAVADALKDQADHKIVVEGHTDSQGSEASNMELSRGRAQSVREYLVQRGVPADRIRAEGLGPNRPVAENKSPEGRANNRRVEIIVEAEGSDTTSKDASGSKLK